VAVQPPQPGGPGVANAPPGQRQPPAKGVPNTPATLLSGLDKITGRIINFDEDIGETVQFGALRVKTSACYTRPSTEAANTDAFVEVDEITLQGEVKRIFYLLGLDVRRQPRPARCRASGLRHLADRLQST
jgi:hypothetical protein